MVIAGVMSGSSLDGLDIAVVHFDGKGGWKLLWSFDMPYSEKWVGRLKTYDRQSASEYIKFKADYSMYIGQCLLEAFRHYDGPLDCIGFHGHTLVHLPKEGITEQIGNGGVLAAMLNTPCITDFRIQDVIKGGVGTPLAPLVEFELFAGHDYYLNLGGIANITRVENQNEVLAYDICPCNQVLNYFARQLGYEYDDGGSIARGGKMVTALYDYLRIFPYFQSAPPKSLDNNWIVKEVIPGMPKGPAADMLHSYTRWMSECIAAEIPTGKSPTTLMVSGGGGHNTYFMDLLASELEKKRCKLVIPDLKVIDFKEAILMALMAHKYLSSQHNVLSRVTGASSDSIGGALYKS